MCTYNYNVLIYMQFDIRLYGHLSIHFKINRVGTFQSIFQKMVIVNRSLIHIYKCTNVYLFVRSVLSPDL